MYPNRARLRRRPMLKHREYFQSEDSNLPRNMSPHVKIREICSDKSIRWHQASESQSTGIHMVSWNHQLKRTRVTGAPVSLKPLTDQSCTGSQQLRLTDQPYWFHAAHYWYNSSDLCCYVHFSYEGKKNLNWTWGAGSQVGGSSCLFFWYTVSRHSLARWTFDWR